MLQTTSARAASSRGIPLSVQALPDRSRSPFEHSLDTADYRAAISFAGDLFLCGRSSLTRYGADGGLNQVWRVGEHFPPYPLVGIAVRRGIGVPELWVATEGAGVLIYDGKQMKQMLPSVPGLRKISALLAFRNGQVILGTPSSGLYVTDGKRLDLLHPQFSQTKVAALAGDEDELWIGTRDNGAWMWRAGEATHFSAQLPDPQVLSIYRSETTTWIGTALGVAEFVDGRFRRPLAEGVFAQSLLAHSGVLSIGTLEEGVISISLGGPSASKVHGKFSNVVAFSEEDGEILAVSPTGLTGLSTGEKLIPAPDFSLSSAHVSALHIDSRGRLWIGYFDRGLDILEQGIFSHRTHLESDVLFCVNRIKEDPQRGTVAVATANGLALFDAGAQLRQTLNRANGLIADHVTDLLFQPNATESAPSLTVATPSGISFVESGSISSLSAFQGLVNNHVYTLAERDNTLVAGTLGGMSILHNGSVQASYNTTNSSLRQNWITASATAGDDVFLGTYGSGVIRVDRDSTITSFREFAKQRVEINPNALLSTNRFLYAGTAAQGLAVLRLGDTRWHFVRDGLPSLNVTALAASRGIIDVGTDNGLVSAPEERLNP